jgi:hypothetical protein
MTAACRLQAAFQPSGSGRHFFNPTPHEELRMAMRLTKNLGLLLLAIWLILSGLIPLLNLSFSGLGTLMGILAIAAGVLILIGR